MKNIVIADTTLCKEGNVFSFKEKLEIARSLERLNVNIIEMPEISNIKTDTLLVRTVCAFIKSSMVSVAAGSSAESIENAAAALSGAAHARIRIELPVSPVGMEYNCHKKPAKMLEWITTAVGAAHLQVAEVEFCAVDATRAETDFLLHAIDAAVSAGASFVTLCDSTAEMMPDDFADFAEAICKKVSVPVGVCCNDKNGLACAQAILAVKKGISCVKTAVGESTVPLEIFAQMLNNCQNNCGFSSTLRYTELHRLVRQIVRITDAVGNKEQKISVFSGDDNGIRLDAKDNKEDVVAAASKLGYDLSGEDQENVYEEFLRVAEKKNVGAKELDAIVASVALQVPPTYKLISYVINNGNIIPASAQVTLEKQEKQLQGICIGDGPIDAAFRAIEQIIGHHYELDDFQIQAVTEGREAMGSALVKLRSDGKLYSGNGISTDIIGASIRAFLNAVNKIVCEEA